jgi:site-specific recombinase XerD
MLKVSFFLRPTARPGVSSVYFHLCAPGIRTVSPITARVKVETSTWCDVLKRSRGNQRANDLLTQIEQRVARLAQDAQAQGGDLDPEAIKRAYLRPPAKRPDPYLVELCEQYIKHQACRVAPGTIRTYRVRLGRLRVHLGRSRPRANHWERADCMAFYQDMVSSGKTKDYALKSVAFLRQVYRFGGDFGICDRRDPTAGFVFSYDHNKIHPVDHLTANELERLRRYQFASEPLNQARDLFVFQAYTGLAWADLATFDPARHIVTNGGGVFVSKQRAKNSEPATLPLYGPANEVLERHGGKLPLMCAQFYNRLLKEVGAILGFKVKMTSHLARKTAATLWLNSGIRLEVVAKMLGHASAQTTQRYYAKILLETVEREAGRWS